MPLDLPKHFSCKLSLRTAALAGEADMLVHVLRAGLAALLVLCALAAAAEEVTSGDQLLRIGYDSAVTGARREYFVYLPAGYEQEPARQWPVILFLHGNGERGNGLDELDYVLRHGPLMEAWIQRRPLPFIIVSPQLPLFGELEAIAEREGTPKPARLPQGAPPRNYGFPSDIPIQRGNAEEFPPGVHQNFDPFAAQPKLPAGWDRIDTEVLAMVDQVLANFSADAACVYLTGISMGGFGSFHMAGRFPDRWAAMAPIVAAGRLEAAQAIAEARLPIWMFGGGKDTIVKPHWLYRTARALEAAGHPALRFTMHEDMDHDAWKRVYEGEDLYHWFLRYRSDRRPTAPEKSP